MKVAVLGCGAIGGLFLGYLWGENIDVIGIVKDYQKEPLLKDGLFIEGVRGSGNYKVRVDTRLQGKVDLAIFASKIGDLEEMIKENIKHLKEATIISTQNGVRADYILSKYFPKQKIITGIVMFGATFYRPNKVVHNFKGDLILGNIFGEKVADLEKVNSFLSSVFDSVISDKIKGAKYLKLFINLNNCIPAILGLSMQEAFSGLKFAKIAIELNREAFNIVKASGIELADLPTFPLARLERLVSMEVDKAADIFSKVMASLSREPLYGSILQSIKSGKPSEIDYINGEIVSLAKKNNLKAPINEKIVELVHRVQDKGSFISKQDLSLELESVRK
ncbi:MAG: ketopantoate reductase family protein [Candidatus Omnitrophica bacterium]|nr:ketopantoate reductase family protein [Candidatus Omnitrophota bacterium]